MAAKLAIWCHHLIRSDSNEKELTWMNMICTRIQCIRFIIKQVPCEIALCWYCVGIPHIPCSISQLRNSEIYLALHLSFILISQRLISLIFACTHFITPPLVVRRALWRNQYSRWLRMTLSLSEPCVRWVTSPHGLWPCSVSGQNVQCWDEMFQRCLWFFNHIYIYIYVYIYINSEYFR